MSSPMLKKSPATGLSESHPGTAGKRAFGASALLFILSTSLQTGTVVAAQTPAATPKTKMETNDLSNSKPIKTVGNHIGIAIVGTIIQTRSEDNVALIKETNGTVRAVKKGHKILEKYTVIAIHSKHLQLRDTQNQTYLVYQDKFMVVETKNTPSSKAPLSTEGSFYREEGFERKDNQIAMTAIYRDKLVQEDLAKILMQATVEPVMANGKIKGFRIFQIDEDSIYTKAGLLNNDVISAINGQELQSVARSISLLQSLKNSDSLEIDLERQGKPLKITIQVK